MFNKFKEKLKGFFAKEDEKEELKEENKEKIEYLTEKAEKEIKSKEKEKTTQEKPKEEVPKKEEPKEEPKEKKGIFSKFKKTKTIKKEDFNEFFEELENLMLENNVALEVVDKIKEDMEQDLVESEIKSDIQEEIKKSLKKSLESILLEPFNLIEEIKKEQNYIILFFGINGSGKTTTISKIASKLKEENISCVLAAGDTFRAASIEQLQKHGEKLGIKVIHQSYGADPAAVAFDAIKYAKSHGIKAVLIDTAGRMHTKSDLLREMQKIIKVTNPNLKIFVAESITGNDAVEQAKTFKENFGIDATILSKADVDEKGGTAISISYITGKPILYLGTGQEYKDLEKFSPKEIIANLGLD